MPMHTPIIFERDEAALLATFIAQLVREGVAFEVDRGHAQCFRVILSGGY